MDKNVKLILKKYFGFDSLRENQIEPVNSILNGEDVLVIMPTGGGKSLCFQLPGLMKEGLIVVISPLIALMKDQVDSLKKLGISAEYINSSLKRKEEKSLLFKLKNGGIKFLYVAPERFSNDEFRDIIKDIEVSMLVVDEAHCISVWGHDFRPSYKKINKIRKFLNYPQTCFFTATATKEVIKDIEEQFEGKLKTIVHGFNRKNLYLDVEYVRTDKEKLEKIVKFCKSLKNGSMIIYSNTVDNVEKVYTYLKNNSIDCGMYYGSMNETLKKDMQNAFLDDRYKIMVCTNAFGMGIDKKDIRIIIHFNFPGSIEHFYQEAGRAGRDGQNSRSIIFYTTIDKNVQEFFIDNVNPTKELLNELYEHLTTYNETMILKPYSIFALALEKKYNERQIASAIKVLAKNGVLKLTERRKLDIEIEIRNFKNSFKENSILKLVFTALLKKATKEQNSIIKINLEKLSEYLNLTYDKVIYALRNFVEKGLLYYKLPEAYYGITLTNRFKPLEYFKIDYDFLRKKYLSDREKLINMINYCKTNDCRRKFILNYFNETPDFEKCNFCDNCFKGKSVKIGFSDLKIEIKTVLNFVNRYDSILGINKISAILTGSKNKNIKSYFNNKFYNKLENFTQKNIVELMYILIENSILEQSTSKFPTVSLGEDGRKLVSSRIITINKKLYNILVNNSNIKNDNNNSKKIVKSNEEITESKNIDQNIISKLQKKRIFIALQKRIAPYMVFTNAVIKEIATLKPKTKDELLKIKGLGKIKIEKYGDIILQIVRNEI